jgi:hypothetical protein
MVQPPIRPDVLTRFQKQGDTPMAKTPLSVRMPEDIDAIVRAKPNRTQWLRDAILEKLDREDNLPTQETSSIEPSVTKKSVKPIQSAPKK